MLRRLGVDVQCFSIWQTAQRDLLSPIDREEWRATDALLPPRPSRFLGAHVRAMTRGARAYVSTLRRALSLSSPGARGRLLPLSWFVEAITLWDTLRQRGIRHIHAHLGGTAPMVAMLVVEFGNACPAEAGPWSWSQTVHGSKEFYEVHRERLDARAASASFTVCVSDYTRSQVMAFVPEELWHKLIVVRCGVDVREFVRRSPRSGDYPHILTVGRVDAMKGTMMLLRALVVLREDGLRPILTIVGDGPSKDKAVAMANRLGLGDQVRWKGAVGQDRIRAFYADADVFCLPSFAEGVPIVLMEAMAMEVPVVANAITGIVELVEDGTSGFLVRPGRVDSLVEGLGRLLQDPDLRVAMGRAGRAKIVAEYNLLRNTETLAQLFGGSSPGDGRAEPPSTSAQVPAQEAL